MAALGAGAPVSGALAFCLAGCELFGNGAPAPEPPDLDHAPFGPTPLAGEVVHESDLLGMPARIAVVESRLVIVDVGSRSAVHVLDIESGIHLRSFGRTGQGPGEFMGAWSIDPAPARRGELWIYDLSLRRLTRATVLDGSGGRADEDSTVVSIQLLSEAVVLDPMWTDSIIVSVGFFLDGRLGRFDRYGTFLGTMGEPPAPKDGVSRPILQHAYQSRLVANPSRTRFAVLTRHADLLDIYDRYGALLARAEPPFAFLPEYSVREQAGSPVLATGLDLRFGYVDAAATETNVYALFSGRTRRGFPGRANLGEYIHVYDWDATLLEVYRLDADAIALAVDPVGEHLYVLRHDPEPAVVRYPLRMK